MIMNRDEAREWLRVHGIQSMTAENMLTSAVNVGSSSTIGGVFITYDDQMFNVYEVA